MAPFHWPAHLSQDGDRPRGRKRNAAPSQDDDTAQDAKPKRGRKKAAVATATDPAAISTETFGDEQNSPPKKGRRGRPPKSATPKEATPAKGRRGRKKAPSPEEEEQEEEREEEGAGSSEATEVKAKTGRQARTPRRSQKRYCSAPPNLRCPSIRRYAVTQPSRRVSL